MKTITQMRTEVYNQYKTNKVCKRLEIIEKQIFENVENGYDKLRISNMYAGLHTNEATAVKYALVNSGFNIKRDEMNDTAGQINYIIWW